MLTKKSCCLQIIKDTVNFKLQEMNEIKNEGEELDNEVIDSNEEHISHVQTTVRKTTLQNSLSSLYNIPH